MLTLSIVIPAHNEEKYLDNCLQSLLRYKTANVIEIIVVDNASADRTAEVAAKHSGVRVLREERKGTSWARECGFLAASGEIIAFVDADSRVTSSTWFQQIESHFEKNPSCVLFSGACSFYDGSILENFLTKMYFWLLVWPMAIVTQSIALGSSMAIRRSALLQVGGFDTSITFYGDDTNIAKRMKAVGTVCFDPRFLIVTSARRLHKEKKLRTAVKYVKNFFSQLFFRTSVTTSHEDIR